MFQGFAVGIQEVSEELIEASGIFRPLQGFSDGFQDIPRHFRPFQMVLKEFLLDFGDFEVFQYISESFLDTSQGFR